MVQRHVVTIVMSRQLFLLPSFREILEMFTHYSVQTTNLIINLDHDDWILDDDSVTLALRGLGGSDVFLFGFSIWFFLFFHDLKHLLFACAPSTNLCGSAHDSAYFRYLYSCVSMTHASR